MSRIGRKPINIPAGVTASVDNGVITVKGPKGTLDFKFNPAMTVEIKGDVIEVTRPNDAKENRSLHGLTRTLIHNMVIGVTEGYSKTLEVNGVGYRVQKQGNKCVMNLGYSLLNYLPLPALPSLRRITSSAYLIPLPLYGSGGRFSLTSAAN